MNKSIYTFEIENDLKAYDSFIEANGGWYIQSSRWSKVKSTWECTYVSGFKGEKRVLCALVMKRVLPVVGAILYCPNGPVMQFEDDELLKAFVSFCRVLLKLNKAACFIMDPVVPLRIDGEENPNGVKMHQKLLNLGFQLNPNVTDYTYKEPVSLFVPLKDEKLQPIPVQKLLKRCDKGVRYSVRLGLSRGLVAKTFTYADVKNDPGIMEDFVNVMNDTSSRDSFVARDGDYCQKILAAFENCSDLKIVYYDKSKDEQLQVERQKRKEECLSLRETAHEKKQRQLDEEINSIDKQSEHFNSRKREVEEFISSGGQMAKANIEGKENLIPLAGGLSIYYAGMGSCLFGGTKNVIRNNTRSSHYLNYLRLCESIDRGLNYHDLGYIKVQNPSLQANGTLAPMQPLKNFEGILSFKKSFGSNLVEFIGEYVLVENKSKYLAYSKLMPAAKHAKVALTKKLRG